MLTHILGREDTAMGAEERIKVTLNLPKALVKQAKIAAVEREVNLQDLVAEALRVAVAKGRK